MSNRLANETSPYLLQHADNPVDWYPWGDEAFEAARASDRPILLSVGYSSCHWCHVMAHESFENPDIADLMNRYFVNVKVDREERPDIDNVYMGAVQAMTGQGGWPMTVFLTPDGEPFYAGTYFPPEDGYGRPGFPRVLEALHQAWTNQRSELLESASKVREHLQQMAGAAYSGPGQPSEEHVETALQRLRENYDAAWGGFGSAPKFPMPPVLEFLLAHHARSGGAGNELQMVTHTLRRMWSGGMYDHLGGGFARYSVDAEWVVPHFEKMLYDNAQLARVYLHAYQVTGDPLFERVVNETLRYLQREMLDSDGGLYSAQDADSEGIEGKFFVWTRDELRAALGDEDGELAARCFGVGEQGNFHDPHHPELTGRSVLTRRYDPVQTAMEFGIDPVTLDERLEAIRARLFEARSKRVSPGLDDKVLVSWNGLALAAFAEAGRVLGEQEYVDIARRNAAFVRETMWRDGALLHTYRGGRAHVDGMLDDYAYYGLGLIELYRATGDIAHLEWAADLFRVLLAEFHDAEGGGFFDTPAGGERLLVRQKSLFDASLPSGNGAAAQLAAWLGRYYANIEWERLPQEVIGLVERVLGEAPTGFGSVLQVVELLLSPRRELVIVGPDEARQPLERVAAGRFEPHLLLAPTADAQGLPHFEGRAPNGKALAYYCRDMVCELPADSPAALEQQLAAT